MRDTCSQEIFIGRRSHSWFSWWTELRSHKDLIVFLVWKDLLVRYRQAVLGVSWVILKPALTMMVFTFVFSRVAKLDSGAVPYSVFVLAALVPWQFFASAVSESSSCLIEHSNMISKIYFPRIALPISAILVNLFDACITLCLLVLLALWFVGWFSFSVLLLPLMILQIVFLAAGFGCWLAALNVKYRDFRYIVPFVLQIGLYASPVGYSSNVVPEKYQTIFLMNPLVGIINGFRFSLFGVLESSFVQSIVVSFFVTFLIFLSGLTYFRKVERGLADII